MKRAATTRQMKRTGNIRKDLTKTQLAGIGAVALAYNENERAIDLIFASSLGLSSDTAPEVTSRINGIEGKIEILKTALGIIGATQSAKKLIADALGKSGFLQYKQYRDAIIHAIVLDAPAGIGSGPLKRGKACEVLMTARSLNALYKHQCALRIELFTAMRLAIILKVASEPKVPCGVCEALGLAPKEPQRPPLARDVRAATTQLRKYQKRRLSLPPLPEFPAELLVPPMSVKAQVFPPTILSGQ